ncbi:hypothetical protein COP2_023105 [Malus domestica]
MARSSNNALRSTFDGHPKEATSNRMSEGEVPRIAEMSMMEGVVRPKGKIMVLVVEHQKNLSIHLTQATQVTLVEDQTPWGFVRHHFDQSNPCSKGVRQRSLKRLVMDDGKKDSWVLESVKYEWKGFRYL